MEKITKKIMIPKYIQVQSDEFKEQSVYKTVDGKEFVSFDDAMEHEDELKYGKEIPSIDTGELISTGYSWYKARDEEELEYLIRRLSKRYVARDTKEVKPNEWFSVVYDYDPNGPDTATFVPLSELKRDIEDLMNQLSD